jgi:hypothetical protein
MSVPAAPAFAKVTVVVVNEGNKPVRSNIWLRVGNRVADLDAQGSGPYVFDTVSCNGKTHFKIEPTVRLYVSEGEWLPCKQRIVYVVRPLRFGAAAPVAREASPTALAGAPPVKVSLPG